MREDNYLYTFKYNHHYRELCRLEATQIFGEPEKNNLLFSRIKVEPSISPFIKSRFEIILSSPDYSELLKNIKNEDIHAEGFKAEYLVLEGDTTGYKDRLKQLKEVGYRIEGDPDYYHPSIIYSICYYQNIYHFGILTKHNPDWQKHKQKPAKFSSSISINIAKSLVSIAAKGDQSNRLLDACCGVGTVMLEACFSGFEIEGCDINWKACKKTRENLAYYNYTAQVFRSDVKDLTQKYDAAIIDLPYDLYTHSNDTITFDIIASVAKLTTRIVIVSITDIEPLIKKAGLRIADFCVIKKRGTKNFTRNIWVCEKYFGKKFDEN